MLYNLNIGDVTFKVAVVSSQSDMRKGLSNLPKIGKNKGMLFDFNRGPHEVTMNMADMLFSIEMLFLKGDGTIIESASLDPGEEDITVDKVTYVLELPEGAVKNAVGKKAKFSKELVTMLAGESEMLITSTNNMDKGLIDTYKQGGVIAIKEDAVKADRSKMQVLDDQGVILMNIEGGERIFSIKHTEQLVSMAKKVEEGKVSPEKLGKLLASIIDTHATQKPQYTS